MDVSVNRSVGGRLKKIREMLEIKVMDMADSLELSVGYYRKLERGDHAISLPLLILLHDRYGIDLNYLITGKAREEDVARDLVCGEPEEMFYLLHRLLDTCENTYNNLQNGEGESVDKEYRQGRV